jgi:hypothetical protein
MALFLLLVPFFILFTLFLAFSLVQLQIQKSLSGFLMSAMCERKEKGSQLLLVFPRDSSFAGFLASDRLGYS